jgi:LPPG:FO 2-phospho-L-lactate transferase
VTSIGPILAVPGIQDALVRTPAPVVAVSPIVGGQAVSGPAAKLLAARGLEVSPLGVARAYRPWLDALVVDRADASLAPALQQDGVRAVVADALMPDGAAEVRLARTVLEALGVTP